MESASTFECAQNECEKMSVGSKSGRLYSPVNQEEYEDVIGKLFKNELRKKKNIWLGFDIQPVKLYNGRTKTLKIPRVFKVTKNGKSQRLYAGWNIK